jgi:hypothetical protein
MYIIREHKALSFNKMKKSENFMQQDLVAWLGAPPQTRSRDAAVEMPGASGRRMPEVFFIFFERNALHGTNYYYQPKQCVPADDAVLCGT